MKPAFQRSGFYAIVLPNVEGHTFYYDGLIQGRNEEYLHELES